VPRKSYGFHKPSGLKRKKRKRGKEECCQPAFDGSFFKPHTGGLFQLPKQGSTVKNRGRKKKRKGKEVRERAVKVKLFA